MIIKCKMCGGDLHPEAGSTTCECEFCGTVQTIPMDDGEKKTNLFNRANRLRMNAEFDKAAAVYESIAAEFPEEAEAYWGLCLCAYGIEYVDDPSTGEKKPTCHRTLPTSIMEDSNFDQACENADPIARRVYREEAKAIDQIQKDILSIVSNEQPYDTFICYKETTEEGGRTEDSVLAQEIYDALTEKGLKVFFARITLEDKLGQEYEPYIYAALSSAKVLLAVGTKFEYYDAIWVKNEWMRFLSMMKTDKSKTLIPCYKGLDAYDMPKEFKNLQAQDMSKLGWIQDLSRGVIKLCGKEKQQSQSDLIKSIVNQIAERNKESVKESPEEILSRAFKYLENEKWDSADECADLVLDDDPSNAQAYLVRLMIETKSKKPEDMYGIYDIYEKENYKKIVRLGNDEQRKQICQIAAGYYLPRIHTIEEYQRSKIKLLERFDDTDIAPILEQVDSKIKSLRENAKSAALEELKRASNIIDCKSIRERIKSIEGLEDIQESLKLVDKKIAELEEIAKERKNIDEQIGKLKEDFYLQDQIAASTEREAKNAKNNFDVASDECEKISTILKGYEDELNNLHGLFTGKRRKELEELIANENRNLKQASDRALKFKTVWENAKSKVRHAPDKQELVYSIARQYYNAGMYKEAYEEYQKIPNYKDVVSILRTDKNIHNAIIMPFTQIGAVIKFGKYFINNDKTKDPMEWIVLDVNENKSLLVSRYLIDKRYYNHEEEGNWTGSEIRTWLNHEFYNAAFSDEEKRMIILSTLDYLIGRKVTCQDKVFLLSEPEVKKYFPTETLRKCSVTQRVYNSFSSWDIDLYNKNNHSTSWWERSNSDLEEPDGYADYVLDDGRCTADVLDCCMGIRPAIWIDI